MRTLTHNDIQSKIVQMVRVIRNDLDYKTLSMLNIYPVPRGGIPVAYLLRGHIKNSIIVDSPELADIIVDDIIDSGATKARYNKPFYALYENTTEWLEFPWEVSDKEAPVSDNIERIKQFFTGGASIEEKQILIHELQDLMEDICEIKE